METERKNGVLYNIFVINEDKTVIVGMVERNGPDTIQVDDKIYKKNDKHTNVNPSNILTYCEWIDKNNLKFYIKSEEPFESDKSSCSEPPPCSCIALRIYTVSESQMNQSGTYFENTDYNNFEELDSKKVKEIFITND